MTIQAQTPDGMIHEFPDGTPDGVIDGAMQTYLNPPPSTAMDVTKSVGSNLAQGALAVPLGLGNLGNSLVAGPQLLGRGVASTLDKAIGIPEQPRGDLWQPFYDSTMATKDLGIDYQPKTAAGAAAAIPAQVLGNLLTAKGFQAVPGMIDDAMSPSQNLGKFMQNNAGEPSSVPPTQEAIKTASGAAYQQMRDAGASLNQNGLDAVTTGVNKALSNTGLMNPSLHGDTLSVVKQMSDDAASGKMDLEKLDQYRQLLNQVVTKNTSKIDGANPDAFKANVAIHALDDAVDSLGQQHLANGTPDAIAALNQARDLYSAQAKMSTVQRIQDNAYMTDNPATAMKTGFKNLAKQVNINPRGYTPDEVAAINDAAKTGLATGALKLMGSRLISSVVGGMAGASSSGGLGTAIGAGTGAMVATPLRSLANAMQAQRGNQVLNLIATRPEVLGAMMSKP